LDAPTFRCNSFSCCFSCLKYLSMFKVVQLGMHHRTGIPLKKYHNVYCIASRLGLDCFLQLYCRWNRCLSLSQKNCPTFHMISITDRLSIDGKSVTLQFVSFTCGPKTVRHTSFYNNSQVIVYNCILWFIADTIKMKNILSLRLQRNRYPLNMTFGRKKKTILTFPYTCHILL